MPFTIDTMVFGSEMGQTPIYGIFSMQRFWVIVSMSLNFAVFAKLRSFVTKITFFDCFTSCRQQLSILSSLLLISIKWFLSSIAD